MLNKNCKESYTEDLPVNVVLHRIKYNALMLICPFSVNYDANSNRFILKTSVVRKVTVISLTALSTVYIFWKSVTSSYSNPTPIMGLFSITLYTCWFYSHLASTYVMICHGDKVVDTFNQMQKVTDILREHKLQLLPRICKWAPWAFTVLLSMYVFLDAFGLNLQIDDVGVKSLIPSLPRYKPGSVKESYNDTCVEFPCIPSDFMGASITVLFFFANIYVTAVIQSTNCIVAEYAVGTWILVRAFTNYLQQPLGSTSYHYKQKMLDILDEISVLYDMINDTWGNSIAVCCLGWLPLYVLKLVRIFAGWRHNFQYIYIYHIFTLISIYVPAASANSRIQGMSKWLKRLQKHDGSVSLTGLNLTEESKFNNRVHLLLHDIGSPGIGIRGQVFTVTYALLGEVIVITLAVLTTAYIFWKSVTSSYSNTTPIMGLFNITLYTCWFFSHLVSTYILICHGDKVVDTFNQMQKVTDILREHKLQLLPTICKWAPWAFTVLLSMYVCLDGLGLNLQIDDVGVKSLLPSMPRYKPGSLKESYNDTCLEFPCIPGDIMGATITVLFFFANIYETVIIQGTHCMVADYSVGTWILVRAYTNYLQQPLGSTSYHYKQNMLDILDEISVLYDMVNDTWGTSIALCCLGWLPLFVLKLVRISVYTGWKQHFQYVYFYHVFTLICIYIPAASANSRIQGMSRWLKRLQKHDESVSLTGLSLTEELKFNNRIQLLLHDIGSPGIGIRGKVFTVTYALLGEVLGLIITYTVILLQFNP
ncbi:unnamed protein product [Allacma fusca]|uniref:Gustatory receptor n=1 Tax=Allacma fusca TaxID=39272 RepID=A0A8J2LPR3_9HEXA|nr:unnamed protein product [Allacma fusca]